MGFGKTLNSLVVLTTILVTTEVTNVNCRLPCSRVIITGLNPIDTPYAKYIEGIYTWANPDKLDEYPIYSQDVSTQLMYYSDTYKRVEFSDMLNGNTFFGYTLKRGVDYKNWQNYISYGDEPFKDVIDIWYYRNTAKRDDYVVPSSSNMKLKCVDDDFMHACSTEKFYIDTRLEKVIDGELQTYNIPELWTYKRLPGVIQNNRPVYTLDNVLYLHHYGEDPDIWMVGYTYDTGIGIAYVQDSALRPEYITNQWKFFVDGDWKWSDMKIRCRSSFNTTCANISCNFRNKCHDRSDGTGYCICPHGYQGETCGEMAPQCPENPTVQNAVYQKRPELVPKQVDGDHAVYFCEENYTPSFLQGTCNIGNGTATWNMEGECTLSTTTTTTTTRRPWTWPAQTNRWVRPTSSWSYWDHSTYSSPVDFDEAHPWVFAFATSITCIWEILFPIVLWITLICISAFNEVEEDHHKEDLEAKWSTHVDKQFDEFIAAHPEIDFEAVEEPPPSYTEATGQPPSPLVPTSSGAASEEKTEEPEVKYIFQSNPDYQRFKADLLAYRDTFNEENKLEIQGCRRHVKNVSFLRISSFNSFLCMWVLVLFLIIDWGVLGIRYSSELGTFSVIAIIFVILDFIYVFIESFFSSELQYLKTLKDADAAIDFIAQVRQSQATITLNIENYHYELRTQTVYYTDANGNLQSYLQTYQERVVSSRDFDTFRYSYWRDESAESISNINTRGITKIKVSKKVEFGDSETILAFSRACEAIKAKNENEDLYMDFETDYFIPGYKQRLATFLDKHTIPCWINQPVYYVCSVLGLTWVFRVAFRLNTGSAIYQVKKRIFLNTPSTGETYNNYTNSDEAIARDNLRDPDKGVEEKAGKTRSQPEASARVDMTGTEGAAVQMRTEGEGQRKKPKSRISLRLEKQFRRSAEEGTKLEISNPIVTNKRTSAILKDLKFKQHELKSKNSY